MMNIQGPDKGLFDVLFGSKPEAAQAGMPATQSGEAVVQTPEEFVAALAKAQDQKDVTAAKQQPEQPKGEIKQAQPVTSAKAEVDKKAAAAKQKAAAEAASTKKPVTKAETEEAKKAKAKAKDGQQPTVTAQEAAVAAQLQAGAQSKSAAEVAKPEGVVGPKPLPQAGVQAQVQAQAQTAQAQAQAQVLAQAKTQGQAQPKAAASTAGGVPGVGAEAAVITAQAAAITSQQAAIAAQQAAQAAQAATAAHGAAVQAGGINTIALQPVVIQMPLAMPVEVLDVSDADLDMPELTLPQQTAPNHGAFGRGSQLVSSQDFLSQMGITGGAVLGLDRADPRLPERERAHGDDEIGSKLGMMLPQLGGHYSPADHAFAQSAVSTGSGVEVTMGRAGRPELANSVALASQVAGLASRGGGAIRMKVMPEALGELTIHVKNEGGKLDVRFEATSHEAGEALKGAMPELRQMLSSSRFEVGKLEVSAASSTLAVADTGKAVGLGSLSSQFSSSDWQGNGAHDWQQQQNGQGNAWDRYFDQREARDQQYRQQGGYRRYQQEMLMA